MKLISGEHISWQERLGIDESDALVDDEGFDDLFEALDEGGGASSAVSMRRVPLSTGVMQNPRIAAQNSAQNWDSEFANAQTHAHNLLSKLGQS